MSVHWGLQSAASSWKVWQVRLAHTYLVPLQVPRRQENMKAGAARSALVNSTRLRTGYSHAHSARIQVHPQHQSIHQLELLYITYKY